VNSTSESFYGPAVALTGQHRGFPKKIQMEEYKLKQTSKILHELHRYKKVFITMYMLHTSKIPGVVADTYCKMNCYYRFRLIHCYVHASLMGKNR
jgi:hypothetical protein